MGIVSSNPHRIAFILCTNDSLYEAECRKYLGRLHVPEGYEVEILAVRGAPSMCAGYNQAMRDLDAAVRIYLHQDVMVLNPFLLDDLLCLFRAHPRAGMIGMVGNRKLSSIGVMWKGEKKDYVGALYQPEDRPYIPDRIDESWPVARVECVDGFLIATRVDIPWREDLFDGWDFYDASQSFELRRRGYDILVPAQDCAWCLHDDGYLLELSRYDHYRQIFLREYGGELTSRERTEEQEAYLKLLARQRETAGEHQAAVAQILGEVDEALRKGDGQAFVDIRERFSRFPYRESLVRSTELLRIKQIAEAVALELRLGVPSFLEGASGARALREKYLRCTFAFREIEFDRSDDGVAGALRFLWENRVSAYSAAAILYNIISRIGHRERVMVTVAADALDRGDADRALQYLSAVQAPSAETEALRRELSAIRSASGEQQEGA